MKWHYITFEAHSVKRKFIATHLINNNYYIMMPNIMITIHWPETPNVEMTSEI